MGKIAILTNQMDFNMSYSLTGIITDQERMLRQYGNDVRVFFNEKCGGNLPENFVKKMPFSHLADYKSKHDLSDHHKDIVKKTADMLCEELKDTQFVFTHDFLFTGWFLPYGLGCLEAAKNLPDVRWLHWIHSVPSVKSDWWNVYEFGPAHKIVFPNDADRVRVAEQYRGRPQDVRIIPHIKDMRTWEDFSQEACDIIQEYPGIMQADVVSVYPCSVDRLEAKRLEHVIRILAGLKRHGLSICLVVATQWANVPHHQATLDKYMALAKDAGFSQKDICFTSKIFDKKWAVGLPRNILRDLMRCMNLFIFPTREESFGLVLPEASLTSGCFCVLNSSLFNQREISGGRALYSEFGSNYCQHHLNDMTLQKYCDELSTLIRGRMMQSESIQVRTFFRQHNNWDYLYSNYYAPIMAESRMWQ